MFHELYEKVSASCCYVTVFLDDEKVSSGSGFSFAAKGDVLTAAHVITGRWPIQKKDYGDPKQRIFCKFPGFPLTEYQVFFCGITVEVEGFKAPVQLDLAVLLPKTPFARPIPFLNAITNPPRLGERVFVAGYSDELALPFQLETLLPTTMAGVTEYFEAMNKGYMADMTGPLIKQGFVGNIRRIVAENTTTADRVESDFMYVDNSMHAGASGGPVFIENGDVVGVISKRAITSASQERYPNLEVPSGCTVGIGLRPMEFIARRMGAGSG